MSKPIECYLQTSVGYPGLKNGEQILKDCLWWEIVEIERRGLGPLNNCAHVLLKFKSKADRELFKYVFCQGSRQQSVKTIRVRKSLWPDVPYCRMNLRLIYVAEKVDELLKREYPKWPNV